MASIAATEIAERRAPDRARNLAALGVFLLAGAAQLALERAHAHGTSPPLLFATVAFAVAAGVAIAALRKTAFLPDLPRPLDIPRYSPLLYAACLPGAICLLLALVLHGRSAGREGDMGPAMLWLVSLGLLVLPGVWDWLRRPGPDDPARLRAWPELTRDRRVALLVPTSLEPPSPGWHRGYRLVRRTVDRSIQRPAELPLSVLEFERAP